MRMLRTCGAIAVAWLALSLVACSGSTHGSGPTAPAQSNLVLSSITLTMDGQPVADGMSVHRSGTAGGSTRFEARLMNGAHAAVGDRVDMQYARPMGMMNQNGTMTLYDDGTHGDQTANDGVYCYEDSDGTYGFHMMDAAMGQYHYEFWGMDMTGDPSNHMEMTITLVP